MSTVGYQFLNNLGLGAAGSEVVELQTLLTRLGFYHGPITGRFAAYTQTAVIAFQKAHGIAATGTMGALTRATLNNLGNTDTEEGSKDESVVDAIKYELSALADQMHASIDKITLLSAALEALGH